MIAPKIVPKSIKMFYQGEDIPRPWRVEAGAVLKDLTFSIRDEDDEHMDLTPDMFVGSSYISESWNANRKKKKGTRACSDKLTDIKVPSMVPEGGEEEYEFELSIPCLQYSFAFKLKVVPGPVRVFISFIHLIRIIAQEERNRKERKKTRCYHYFSPLDISLILSVTAKGMEDRYLWQRSESHVR